MRPRSPYSIALYKEAMPIFVAAYGEEHEKVALCNLNTGTATLFLGRHDAAEPFIRRALQIYRNLPGNYVRFVASCPSIHAAVIAAGMGGVNPYSPVASSLLAGGSEIPGKLALRHSSSSAFGR